MLQIREEQERCFSRVFKGFAEASAILLLYIKVSVSQGLMVAVLISEFLSLPLSLPPSLSPSLSPPFSS